MSMIGSGGVIGGRRSPFCLSQAIALSNTKKMRSPFVAYSGIVGVAVRDDTP
ncbi:MAG: hypothetical protein RMX96_09370 [Nostoc sp. ChiSLP02]|nr:hypothetical protein [Nostoc sp. DedSLP05]MDZ8101951.1 hypothetical protein [Nostoc sp. DedSLP01]MDZ8185050.1 hypothetical protein [Nostoc sp. ChiSLP02]